MTALYADFAGCLVPLADCDWVLWKQCGCAQALTVAEAEGRVVATEADAWRELCHGTAAGKRAAARGCRVELITREKLREQVLPAFGLPCPHPPPPEPEPVPVVPLTPEELAQAQAAFRARCERGMA